MIENSDVSEEELSFNSWFLFSSSVEPGRNAKRPPYKARETSRPDDGLSFKS